MTRAAKILYFTALALGLLVGGLDGFFTTMDLSRSSEESTRMNAPTILDDFSYVQYRYSDLAHAKDASQHAIDFLKEMEGLQPIKRQEGELAILYTRLALLAEQEGNAEQSHALLTEARRWNATSGGRDHSDAEMKSGLKTLDDLRAPSR
jgi:hypothetical protein